MTYFKVQWKHTFPDEPILLYSELDAARFEVRKIEVFRDGKNGYADRGKNSRSTRLGEKPIPTLEEIAADPQFLPTTITKAEFETMWELCSG